MYNTDKKLKWLQPVVIILLVVMFFANSTENAKAAGKTPELNITELSMSVGQAKNLSVSNNKKKVQWTSSKKSVATVSSKGKIKAKKAGKTVITAKIGNKKFKCNVTVNKPSKKKKDVLIVYFSQTGTTKSVADKIQKLTGGDLLKIREKDKYPDDYDKTVERAKKELNRKSFPKIKTQALNMKSYDVVYVGFPIWWHSTPRVVNTFLKQYNFKGKTVIPFCTSGGSDISEALPEIKKLCKGSTILEGYTADSGSKSEVKKWLTKIGQIGNNSKSGKTLVAYFSWSGTSEKMAKSIIKQTKADEFRIERKTPYSEDYTTTAYGDAKTEADNNERPPIKNPLSSVSQYDKIIICYPIWWHTTPMCVGTFLESYDMTGKTIYPVSQSASMDRGQYEQSVQFIKDCAKGAVVNNGIFTKNETEVHNFIEDIVLK